MRNQDAPPTGRLEGFALFMLVAGSVLLPVVGWLLGVACAWRSRIWTVRDKLIATFVPPGGLLPAIYLFIAPGPAEDCTGGTTASGRVWEHCTGGLSPFMQALAIAAFVVLLIAPFATGFYLHRRAQLGGSPQRTQTSPA
jgi:hypothetical protein